MRKWSSLMLLTAALLFGCGGGGSSPDAGIQEQSQSFPLGFVRGDAPTTVVLQVAKPFYTEGTVDLAEAPAGPFQPVAGLLPMALANGHETSLWITFTPPAAPAATQEGTIRLLFRSTISGKVVPVTLQLRAQVETPSARLMQTDVSAGTVMLGNTGRLGVWVENTSAATPVTVTDVTVPAGEFSIAPDAFPMPVLVAPGSKLYVRLLYSPEDLGTSSSLVSIRHSASANPLEATLTGTGAENFSMQVVQTPVSAGNVVVGETVQFDVEITNPSLLTPVMVTDVTIPGGEFSIAPSAPALPFQMVPGSTLQIPVVYAPQGTWDASSVISIRHSVSNDPLEATVTGTGIAPQIIYTYDLWLDENYESGWQDVYVPAEGVSIFLEAKGETWSRIDLIGFEGPPDSGVVYETRDMAGPLVWQSYYPAGGGGYLNVELPNSDQPDVQMVPGGGWYKFRLRDWNSAASSLQVRVTITQRTAATVEKGTLDVRVFLAAGLNIDPADAMSNATLAEVMKTVDAILGKNGVRLGNISFTVMDASYDTVDGTTMDGMLESSTTNLPENALNLFFVTDLTYGGDPIAGIAGATPGPVANGTPYSGVVIDFNQADAITVGATAAHEIGHYLGHFDMGNEGWLLEADEAYAVLHHPLLNPGLPQDFLSPEATTDYAAIIAAIDNMPEMSTSCGTCMRWPVR